MSRPADCHPDKPAHARGQCHTCYVRHRRRSDPAFAAADAERTRRWQEDNRQHYLETKRRWREAHPEYERKWAKNNAGLKHAATKRWRARRKGAEGSHTEAEWLALLDEYGGRCAYCGEPATTRDHVVPLSRGGSDFIENILPACRSCNSAKRDQTPEEWIKGSPPRGSANMMEAP